jgi:hypothetical protein
VLLNDVEVVQQPVTRGADVQPTLGARIQLMIGAVENLFCVLEAKE